MIEQRKKFAKVKVQASYQIAKSRRQNKIKSKKYHRILRREKTKQQLKDFELLRKTDPEAALKQLEQLERSRAQERATLRHRNTGKWAQNQLIKAKYNRESREAISEQLAKSRELTEKVDLRKESSDSDSGEDEVPSKDSNNTWFANEESDKSQETEQPRQPVDTFSRNSLPDSLTTANEALDDDFDVEDDQKMTIGDVLAAEDVVSEFRMEKQKAEEDEKPQIIDTSLPGWGTWTDGSSVREKDQKKPKYRRTNKRLLFKIPKAPPRKEANKGFVILKESVPEKLKEHMVSELPYPFTKVKDFEAHVRAPIGRTWLPETAHQQLIAPPIITKLGTVIEPMDEGVLIKHEKLHKN